MATKRTPIRRELRRRISCEAVEAFRLALEIEAEGGDERWEDDKKPGRRREYLDALTGLHRALGLKPWQESPVNVDASPRPAWMPESHGWEQAQVLRRQLEEAGR